MATTEWPDTSEHNGKPVDDSMPHSVNAYRATDGTYVDPLFSANDSWTRKASQLVFYIIYNVWPRSVGMTNWQQSFAMFRQTVGDSHRPRLVIMDDVETWSRAELRKDFSKELEAKRLAEVQYLNSLRPMWQRRFPFRILYLSRDNRRVIGYGNRGDLLAQARNVRWQGIILADYSGAPTPKTFNGWRVVGRQYTNNGPCQPWGHCDMNRATVGVYRLARQLGLGRYRLVINRKGK